MVGDFIFSVLINVLQVLMFIISRNDLRVNFAIRVNRY